MVITAVLRENQPTVKGSNWQTWSHTNISSRERSTYRYFGRHFVSGSCWYMCMVK